MGVLKFQLPSPDLARRLAGFRKAYITGLDRTPGRLSVEFRNGLMTCHRETNESGRLFVPWPIAGYGTPIVGTATLAERPRLRPGRRAGAGQAQRRAQPAGRLGADGPADPARARRGRWPRRSRRSSRRRSSADDPEACVRRRAGEPGRAPAARATCSSRRTPPGAPEPAGRHAPSCRPNWAASLDGRPARLPLGRRVAAGLQRRPGRRARGSHIAPSEGQYRWELLDAQLAWCRQQPAARPGRPARRVPPRGPARLDLALGGGLRDDPRLRRRTSSARSVTRYRGKVPLWHLVHRPASQRDPRPVRGGADPDHRPGRSRSPARPTRRRSSPSASTVPGPNGWAPATSSSARSTWPTTSSGADLGLSGIGIEIAPGYSAPGQPPPRPVRLLPAARPLRAAEPPAPRLVRVPSADRPRPARRPGGPGRGRRSGRPRRTRSIQADLGGAVGRPGGRQAVRPIGHLAPGQRRLAPPLPPRRPLPRRPGAQADLPLAPIAPPGCHRMRKRCHGFGGSL